MERFKRFVGPVCLALLVACAWLSPLDFLATEQADAGLKRALVSFATARTLNAVISVAQGTQFAVEPAGVGVNFAPGQLLDPVNDLVEQFSHLMLVASVSFGIQKMLITIGGHWLVSTLLTVIAVFWSLLHLRHRNIPMWLSKALVIVFVVRLAVPIVTVGSDVLFQHFFAEDYAASQNVLEVGAVETKKLNPVGSVAADNQSVLNRLKGWMPQDFNVVDRIDGFIKAADRWPEQVIRLTVIFLLQTLILPVLLLWGLITLVKSIFGQHVVTPPQE